MAKAAINGQLETRGRLLAIRSSPAFVTFVISFAVFTEQFLYAVIVPVAPFSLQERVHVPTDRIQYWVAWLLATYGLASFLTSREYSTTMHCLKKIARLTVMEL